MDIDTIKSYLVSLGFTVNQPQLNKFENALKSAGIMAERSTIGIASSFIKAGAAIVTTLTGIATGTIGLMNSVAENDLGFQLMARRLFTTTDAARKMKIATDALGYSIEEIIWGPPELAERYKALIHDQDKMLAHLGGSDFEKRMRNIRDIRFEFTKMGVEVKYLGMEIVSNLAHTLLGDDDSVRNKIQKFNDWLIDSLPSIARQVSDVLAPVTRDMVAIFHDLWGIAMQNNIQRIGAGIVKVADDLRYIVDLIAKSKDLQRILGYAAVGAGVGAMVGGVGAIPGALIGGAAGAVMNLTDPSWKKFQGDWAAKSNRGEFMMDAMRAAAKYNIPPSMMLGLIQKESGFNPNAVNPQSGASGLMQFMPSTAKQFGINPFDPEESTMAGAKYLRDLLTKYNGDWNKVLKEYGGFVNQDPSSYINDVQKNAEKFRSGTPQPMASHTTIDVGGIYINQPNATPQEIHRAVSQVMDEKLGAERQRTIAQFQGVYA